jgi:thiamine biosynthesis lipoprotein
MDPVRPDRPATGWAMIDIGTALVGVAERDALGTSARVAAWPPYNLARVLAVVDTELARLDEQASRFRDDSEISAIHRTEGGVHILSEGLAEAIAAALAAARWTGGLVDPTVGGALCALGYDRDFAAIHQGGTLPRPARVPGWQSVRLDGRRLRLPAGSRLDLGATAKGLGSDRAASAAAAAISGGGVLVSLGGDIAVAGEAPSGGWPVLVADEQEPVSVSASRGRRATPEAERLVGQVVRLAAGALATSSIMCRQWSRGSRMMHHILDPRTGLPATGPWRTVSVAAANCAEANAAATAAIVAGDQARAWLAEQGLPARLVAHDGSVLHLSGWPEAGGGLVEAPAAGRMPAGPADVAGPDETPPSPRRQARPGHGGPGPFGGPGGGRPA